MDSTLKKNILKNILFFTCIILITLSLFLSIFIYKIKIKDVKQIIRQKNEIITLSINNLFLKIRNYIHLLSNDKRISLLPSLPQNIKKEVLSVYKQLQNIDPDISYIYSGYEDGTLIINDYVPPKGFDPRIRPWYKAALNSYPDISTGVPYREIKTHNWLLSFSKALKDGNEIKGVLSIDVSLSRIIDILEKDDGVSCFILNKNGKIIIHKNFNMLNTYYKINNSFIDGKIRYIHPIKDLGWIVVTEVDKTKIFSPIVYQILICNMIVLMIIITIGWGLSLSFTKNFVYPVIKLKERVENIIENKIDVKDRFKYPKNEIGTIAEKIEFLTQQELYKKNKQLKELSQRDELTKLYNRRYILQAIMDEMERAKRYNTIFSIILFDIDHFKEINDLFGHNIGDRVLKDISQLCIHLVRKTDKVSRWGGEEFLILCPETDKNSAKLLGEKLRKGVENHDFKIEMKVTISAGVAEYSGEKTITQLVEKADKKVYMAKRGGRNKIVA